MDFISGMEGSREEGAKEAQLEMIKAMLKEGLEVETIAKVSKMSIEEIEKIAKGS